MVPAEFQTFFLASVGASAALIGLLFVSVSIAPERVFGQESDLVRQAQALSAFTALANIFFISLLSLIPEVTFGVGVWIIAIPAALQTLALLVHVRRWRETRMMSRGIILFLASAVIYGYEFVLGIQMWRDPTDKGAVITLCFVLMGAYAAGLGRAWELLGAPRTGVVPNLLAVLRSARPGTESRKPKS
jgi:hypothetical protein